MQSYTQLVRFSGNEPLYQAVEMSILSALKGHPLHLHAEGLRGTGKTTILRAAREILPWIPRVAGCTYNCHPARPHCPEHRKLTPQQVRTLGVEWVPMPFLEISPSAKLGTVVGTLDLARLTDRARPEAALLPGTLAQAHRGIVFVDEINRLADIAPELADALLDVMGTKPGRLQIEESGLPRVEMQVQVSVWAASNPDEEPGPLADIRRQLSDRFDMLVGMQRPAAVDAVKQVLWQELDQVPGRTVARPLMGGLPERQRARLATTSVEQLPAIPADLVDLLARVYVKFQLESLRAVQAWQLAARVHALRRGAEATAPEDVQAVAALALRHRVEPEVLAQIQSYLREGERGEANERSGSPSAVALKVSTLPEYGRVSDAHEPSSSAVRQAAEGEAVANPREAVALGRLFDRMRQILTGGGEVAAHDAPARGAGRSERTEPWAGRRAHPDAKAGQGALPQGPVGSIGDPLLGPSFAPSRPARFLDQLALHELLLADRQRHP